MLSVHAPAKVNLGLHVLRRRSDGFHDLATAFLPIGWSDTLTAKAGGDLSLSTTDPGLPTDDRNLVIRAARALADWAGIDASARLTLDKRVPYGAGLGGGSSDAAAALRLLSDLWGLDVPAPDLYRLALDLGSDVPFFLEGVAAVGTGRGEQLAPLVGEGGAPYRCPFWLVVAVPPVHVSTADAFRLVTPNDRDRPDLGAAVVSNNLARWRAELTNDFQPSVEAAHSAIADVRRQLDAAGAGWAALSGTGSAVVGAFADATTAAAAARALSASCRVWSEAPQT